jgi:hypothetical protein
VRDLAGALLIALGFVLLAAPGPGGSTTAFALSTFLLIGANAALVGLLGRSSSSRTAPLRVDSSRGSTLAAAACATAGALLLFVAARTWIGEILAYPNDPYRADMMIVIRSGIRRVLQGRNPYTLYQIPWDATLPYGPVLWAPYIVPYLLRTDTRFISVLGMLVIPVACTLAATGLAAARRYVSAIALLVVVAAIAFSSELRGFASIAHTPSYWPLLPLFAWLVARQRWRAAAVAAGLLLVARSTMVALAPVLLIAIWHRHRRQLASSSLLLAGAAILPYLPFAIWDPQALFYALYGSYQQLMKGFVWQHTTWAHQTIGITGLLLRAGLERLAEPLQAAATIAVVAASWRSIARGADPLAWMAASLLAFSATALWPVHYMYFDVLLLWTAALLVRAPWPIGSSVWQPWLVSLAAAMAIVVGVSGIALARDPVIDVGTGADRALLYRGFSSNEGSERTFAWIEGREARILVVRRSRADAALDIDCEPFSPTAESTQAMSVTLNGALLGTVTLRPGWQRVTLEAPSNAWVVGVNELTLSLSDARSPKGAGTGTDERELSAAIDRLAIRTK